ncbi:hypothetical protein [Alkalilacustris brevis]|uniref:hypothetical protein n=1 Tax=Alkalilacustris brevis TaxID=2026338 RepID=UPI00138FBDC6|nr:hypothetical protein [Alkalilacustris brevis]
MLASRRRKRTLFNIAIDSESKGADPRCFSAVLYEGQFLVLYFVGDQLLMPSSYHAGFPT